MTNTLATNNNAKSQSTVNLAVLKHAAGGGNVSISTEPETSKSQGMSTNKVNQDNSQASMAVSSVSVSVVKSDLSPSDVSVSPVASVGPPIL